MGRLFLCFTHVYVNNGELYYLKHDDDHDGKNFETNKDGAENMSFGSTSNSVTKKMTDLHI